MLYGVVILIITLFLRYLENRPPSWILRASVILIWVILISLMRDSYNWHHDIWYWEYYLYFTISSLASYYAFLIFTIQWPFLSMMKLFHKPLLRSSLWILLLFSSVTTIILSLRTVL